jgi:hypothetical protein
VVVAAAAALETAEALAEETEAAALEATAMVDPAEVPLTAWVKQVSEDPAWTVIGAENWTAPEASRTPRVTEVPAAVVTWHRSTGCSFGESFDGAYRC